MSQRHEPTYTIRQVIDLTGASEFTLRAWENRYHAFRPSRTESGRRRYTSHDVFKARMLLKLTNAGHRIGQIANLNSESLLRLSEEKQTEDLTQKKSIPADVEQMMHWAHRFEWDEIRARMDRKRQKEPARSFIFDFILPLLGEINLQVSEKRLSIAQEHILSAFIKEDLLLLKPRRSSRLQSPIRMVFATPEGDIHEIGLLIASVLASLANVRTLYLGPNLPAQELCDACERFQATHILLVSTVKKSEGARQDLYELIHFLDRNLQSKTKLWIAGRATSKIEFSLKRTGQVVADFPSFERLLDEEIP